MLRLSVHQRRDDISERRQRQVDLGGLLQAVARRSRFRLALAASQVDQVELGGANVLLSLIVGVDPAPATR